MILISVAPTLQNLRTRLRRRQSGKSDGPAKQRGSSPKVSKKKRKKAIFFSPSESRCLLASTLKLQEREVVVNSGTSMHMISINDLNSAEMDTLTKSCSPTTVITANGEVQTHEEATVYVQELDLVLTMKVLENTPAVLSLGKHFDENGSTVKKHISKKNGIRIQCNTENFVQIVVPGFSTSSSSSSHPSTSMTPSTHESHHPTSSSSSSSSPTTTASSDSETREREDQSGIDSPPVPVSSSNVEEMINGRPVVCCRTCQRSQANQKSKTKQRGNHDRTERPVVCC